jgi:hypothetical protein
VAVANVLQQRLWNQQLAGNPLPSAAAVVAHFGAVQAQDYANAKWALGLRMQEATDAIMDDAFNRGEILRLHVMRPTWHFVTPADIRWLVELTAPRVNVANAYRRLCVSRSAIPGADGSLPVCRLCTQPRLAGTARG